MSLRSTNLNLLPILHALLDQQSVSRAAEVLGLSQPATSNALGRLRALFDDPLLVQVGREMRLTPRARDLSPGIAQVCTDIERLLQSPHFDPADAERTFIVATPDYAAFLVGAEIMETLRAYAPKVTVQFVDVTAEFPERLHAGDYDVAMVAWSDIWARGLTVARGPQDRIVGVVNKSHPLAGSTPTLEAVGAYPELRIRTGGRAMGAADSPSRLHLSGQLRIAAEQFMVLPLLASKSECVAFVPGTLAEYFKDLAPISVFELPGDGWSFEACALWSPASDSDPAHRWFRNLITDAMRRRLCIGVQDRL